MLYILIINKYSNMKYYHLTEEGIDFIRYKEASIPYFAVYCNLSAATLYSNIEAERISQTTLDKIKGYYKKHFQEGVHYTKLTNQ